MGEGVHGGAQPRCDGHATQLAGGRNSRQGEGGAEVHHDAIALESLVGGHRVCHQVRAHLGRVFRGDPKTDVQPGGEEEGLPAAELEHRLHHGTGERRHDAGEDGRVDGLGPDPGGVEELAEDDEVFVGGLGVDGLDPPPSQPVAVLCAPKVMWELPTETAHSMASSSLYWIPVVPCLLMSNRVKWARSGNHFSL